MEKGIYTLPVLLECIVVDGIPSDMLLMGGKDSPSGVGRGPTGIALNRGLFSIFSSKRGSPSPARAQFTFASNFLSSSTKTNDLFIQKYLKLMKFNLFPLLHYLGFLE